jgi:trans-aconitate 2-methyltransferase
MRWGPDSYSQFKEERTQPFRDLLQLIVIRPGMSVLDLGCGTGALTTKLAESLPDSTVLGIDNSPEMLEKASNLAREKLRFELRSIEEISGSWDLIFSNAAVHWVAEHYSLIPRLWSMLRSGGQLALQFPSSRRNKGHIAIQDAACESPFREAMDGWEWKFPVLETETYAEILFELDGRDITVFDKVYPHVLNNADDAFDWLSGTTLLPYLERMPGDLHAPFKERIREKLWSTWPSGPFLFPFRRILLSAKKPEPARGRS